MKTLAFLFLATTLSAQVMPAPGWCSMAHCNNQLTDFVPLTPIGLTSGVYVMNRDTARAGVKFGLACVSNGSNFACSYDESPDALVYYDADGNLLWTSGTLLDANTYIGAPLIQADGSVVIGDDQHIFKFNSNGTVAWSTPSPGGQPTSLVTTPNGAIFAATAQVPSNPCPANNCQLAVTVNTPGIQYTSASVSLAGGDCPGATAKATLSGGQVTAVTVTSQGAACIIPPDVIMQGNGSGANATAQLYSPTPVAVYNGTTGALAGSLFLYENGNSGPYYLTTNTPCVNNGSYPNRVYISTALYVNSVSIDNQGALWAVDIDPTNTTTPISPAWNIPFEGPSGGSPLCVGDDIYFDGAGYMGNAGTTIFGAQDSGTSGSLVFGVFLGAAAGAVTTNFALDPRAAGGFWHQLQGDPNIYHRSATTGALIEQIDTSSPILAAGAPPGTYWDAGVFTTYGTADQPYFILSELSPVSGSYLAMYNITDGSLVWALPIYPGNSPFLGDSAEGAAVMAIDSQGVPVIAVASQYNGAYFIANASAASSSLSATSLDFGNIAVGSNSAAETITVTNNASTPLSITSVSASGAFAQTNNCSAALPGGISCAITVVFSPAGTGVQTGALTVTSTAAGSPQAISLAGAGITGLPGLTLSSTTLSFGSQPALTTSRPQTVTLSNSGTAPLTISSIAASGDAIQSNTCAASVPPGASCAIYVMFHPTAQGAGSGAVTIATNNTGSPQAITLTGSGTPTPNLAVGLSSDRLVFPTQMAEATGTQMVQLTNPGSSRLNINSIAASGDVAQTNTCAATLAAGASCLITVIFAPTGTGSRSGDITITDNAAGSPQTIVISGVATGRPVPLLNQPLSPASQLPGAAGFTLTVRGGPFVTGAAVDWNGAPLATSLVSSTELTATVPASSVAAEGTAWINASNPGPGGGFSNTAWFPVATPSATLSFNLSNLTAGGGAQAVATADFNRDGKLDLAVANSSANNISILLGNGDGTFAPAVNYATGNQPVAVAVGDFNGDGKPDLVVANQDSSSVSILLGNGDGTFGTAVAYPTGAGPVALAVADFNGDGSLDVAVANWAGNTVSILAGNGNGTFNSRVDYPAGQSPRALAAGDFNADGILDLAVGNDFSGGTVSILLGSASAGFQAPVAYSTGDSVALVTADFNGDGVLDLAAVNQMEQTLSVLLGNGDGTFQAVEPAPLACPPNLGVSGGVNNCELDPGPVSLAMGDLDGDGSLDLAILNTNAGSVSILPGDGNGVFRKTADYTTAAGPVALVTGDFNGDGSLDLAVAALSSNTISVLLQAPEALVSPSSLSFGNVNLGGSANQTVTLSNGGSAPLRITSITVGGNFSQSNTCGTSLAAGAVCSITVTFTPAALGSATGSLTINDSISGSPQTVALSGTGVVSVTLNLSKTYATGGNPVTANTVRLSSAAPAGGASVTLMSSNPSVAAVPASVLVAAGSTVSPTFVITTTGVAAATPVTMTANYGGTTSTTMLTVNPAGLYSITLSPTSVTSGLSTTSNTVNLDGLAPPAGAVVSLFSANPAIASVPVSMTVSAGARMSPVFTITAGFVTSATPVVISAQYGTSMVTATLTVNPVVLASLTVSPKSVVGGKAPSQSANIAVLTDPAPPGGAMVTLSSSNSAVAAVPASVTVSGGATKSASFPITTTAVAAPTMVTISATYNGVTETAVLTVNPPSPQSVMLSETSVVGGMSVPSNQVLLNGPAPAGGATIDLSSSDPAVAAVPATVTVAAGASSSAAFTITTKAVTSSTAVTISAKYQSVTKTAKLTVTP